jgi:hypothetical protein
MQAHTKNIPGTVFLYSGIGFLHKGAAPADRLSVLSMLRSGAVATNNSKTRRKEISNMYEKLKSLLEVGDLSNTETVETAIRIAQSIEDNDERASTLVELVRALAAKKEWSAAEMVIQSMQILSTEYHYERAMAMRELVAQLMIDGQIERALKFLVEAEKASWVIEEEWRRAESLNRIARILAMGKEQIQARRIWNDAIAIAQSGEKSTSMQDSIDCSSVLWEIAEDLASFGELEKAREVAQSIKNRGKRERALNSIRNVTNKNI